jgi:glutamyl-tRNA synthetase
VVVDDWDMGITQVIRGDDHVNNTPRQINILKALGATVPQYAHLSMILGADGQKLSKRHGAVSVMQYDENGYLPEAVVNYLARLGWSHGDEEIFSVEQFCAWFDLDHVTPSAAQFNTEKLNWLNQHYLKQTDNFRLAELIHPRLAARGVTVTTAPSLEAVIALYKERSVTLNDLSDAIKVFYTDMQPDQHLLDTHITAEAKPALLELAERFRQINWDAAAVNAAIKEIISKHGLKMPKLAMPLRVMLTAQTHTPSVDAVVALFPRETVLLRMARHLK